MAVAPPKTADPRVRVQAYLDAATMEVVRSMAHNLDMPESRVVAHLVKVGLGVQQTQAMAISRSLGL